MLQTAIVKRIKRIQIRIGVAADGIIGPATITAIENILFTQNPDILQTGSLSLSVKGVNELITHEISSKAYYEKFLSRPTWPGGGSGVTIGIGYDLGYHTPKQIQKDWSGQLKGSDLDALFLAAGNKGQAAKSMLDQVRNIPVSFKAARAVFYMTTLVRYGAKTRKAYPGVGNLFPDAQAAILSLVYNRGTAMAGARRKEMAAIKPLVVSQDYSGIADQILAMKRLWVNKGLDGLLSRRDSEAHLVLGSNREYDLDDIIRV